MAMKLKIIKRKAKLVKSGFEHLKMCHGDNAIMQTIAHISTSHWHCLPWLKFTTRKYILVFRMRGEAISDVTLPLL